MARWLGFAVGAVLTAGVVTTGVAGPVAADEPDKSDWPTLCVNAVHRTGRPYRATPPEKVNCRTLRVGTDRRERRFVVQVPEAALDREGPIPVVFMFHGSGGTGEKYHAISRWRELAEEEGIIVVYASALEYRLKSGGRATRWNHIGTRCELAPGENPANDLRFIDAIVDDLVRQIPRVDQDRIYASGFSNGGHFVNFLAYERGEVFAAIGSWAGLLYRPSVLCPVTIPVRDSIAPVWFGIGTKDDYPAEPEYSMNPAVLDAQLDDKLDPLMQALRLDRTITDVVGIRTLADPGNLNATRPVDIAPRFSRVAVHDEPLRGNRSGNVLYVVALDEVEHHYPNSWPGADRTIIRKSTDASMALMHWQFFLDHPMPPGGR